MHMADTYYQPDMDGIRKPPIPVMHRDEEYDRDGFGVLLQMQQDHFWYRGRHRFLLASVQKMLGISKNSP
jgi:hypothetical protein